MKLLVSLLALVCAVAFASAGLPGRPIPGGQIPPESTGPYIPTHIPRFPREANPQNSISIQGKQPLSGPDRRPSIGIEVERNIGKNGFIRGSSHVEPRPSGRGYSPSFGIQGGIRFRREADPQQNSINFQGTQPLSGPNRQPSWDLNFNRNIANNDRSRTDVFGGVNKVPGQRAQPHVGIQYERNFGNNGFIRGSGQLQPRPGGHGLSPSVGITGGFRFRREAEDAKDDEELIEEI